MRGKRRSVAGGGVPDVALQSFTRPPRRMRRFKAMGAPQSRASSGCAGVLQATSLIGTPKPMWPTEAAAAHGAAAACGRRSSFRSWPKRQEMSRRGVPPSVVLWRKFRVEC